MKLYYQGKGTNFGDSINKDIFSDLYHQNVLSARHYTADFIGIGSILGKVFYNPAVSKYARENMKRYYYSHTLGNRPINIMGSGLIEDIRRHNKPVKPFRPLNILALRGHKTQAVLEDVLERSLSHVALGDPGILCSRLTPADPVQKKYKMGVIPHYADREVEAINVLLKNPDSVLLNIKENPYKLMQAVAECETIASTSLHGLVIADSFHVPNLWIRMSDHLMGGNFKFDDYYSTYGIQPEVTDLRELDIGKVTPDFITRHYKVSRDKVEHIKSTLDDVFRTFFFALGKMG